MFYALAFYASLCFFVFALLLVFDKGTYAGNVDKARKILTKAKSEAKHEWKVFLESVLLEMRANSIQFSPLSKINI